MGEDSATLDFEVQHTLRAQALQRRYDTCTILPGYKADIAWVCSVQIDLISWFRLTATRSPTQGREHRLRAWIPLRRRQHPAHRALL